MTEAQFDPLAAMQWLDVLFPADTPGLIHISATGNWAGRAFTDRGRAVDYMQAMDSREGVYLRATTLRDQPAGGGRGGAVDSLALPGLWADLDIAGPGHKTAEQLPPGEDEARQVIEASGLPAPTLWVHSGGGLYPWWLLKQAVVIDDDNRDNLARLSERWQNVIGRAAGSLGWHYGTGVGDLARVLRIPGTVNRKAGLARPCRIIEDGTDEYTFNQLHDGLAAALERHPEHQQASPRHQRHHRPRPRPRPAESVQRRHRIHPGRGLHQARRLRRAAPRRGPPRRHQGLASPALRHPAASPSEQQRAAIADLLPPGSPALRVLEAVDGTSARVLAEPKAERTGGEIPSPNQPLAVARELVARMDTPRAWWRGDFYRHAGTHWDVVEDSSIENWIYRQTENATYLFIDTKGEETVRSWAPTKRKVADVAHALGVGALHREGDAAKVMALTNGVLLISDGRRALLPHSAERFNLFSLPFAYDASAECPAWLAFLESVLPDDREAHEFLGEWFGYTLSGRTDHQKMAALIGERRSGKGTIARILTAMMGQENVAGLDLNLLPGNFGLENLINKSLAISGDVRWHSRHVGDAVPILLQIIGEDAVTAHRKNRSSWNGRLGVRFLMMSNDTPTFSDRSGALGGRMIYLKFDQSFYGREDVSLTDKLLHELPGILNWALDGLERLDGRGRFTEPASGQAEAEAVRRLSDPIGSFLDDWCEIGSEKSTTLDLLFLRYKAWCESEGRTKDTTTKEIFSRDLRSKVPDLVVKRERVNGRQIRILYGVSSDAGLDGAGGGRAPF
jgi:putative DNA primase/helicase